MTNPPPPLLIVLTTVLVGNIAMVYTVAQALVASALGVKPRLISLNSGPRLSSFAVAGIQVRIGLLPIGSFVKFGREEDDTADNALDRERVSVQLAALLAGPASLCAIALACLGGDGWRQFTHGFWQILHGAVLPLSAGASYASRFFEMAPTQPLVALGIASAKIAAFNLFPLPALAGFDVLHRLAFRGRPRPIGGAWPYAGLLLALGWAVAIGAVLFRSIKH